MSLNSLVTLGHLYTHDQEQTHHPIHHLFSPASLSVDLVYVDKTYYASQSPFPPIPSGRSLATGDSTHHKIAEKWPIAINHIHSIVLNKTSSMLASISRLDLQNIGLRTIPNQIVHLTRLTVLNLSNNHLDTISPAILLLKHLEYLNVSNNRITALPPRMHFRKLTHMDLSDNPLLDIPPSLTRMRNLKHLNLSRTLIEAIPAELLELSHAMIKVGNCVRLEQKLLAFDQPLAHNPQSLLEICATQLLHTLLSPKQKKRFKYRKKSQELPQWMASLSDHMLSFMAHPQRCTFCGAPFYTTRVTRYRIVQQQDDTLIPVRYNLCSAHWSDETDRLVALFAHRTFPVYHRDWELDLATVLG